MNSNSRRPSYGVLLNSTAEAIEKRPPQTKKFHAEGRNSRWVKSPGKPIDWANSAKFSYRELNSRTGDHQKKQKEGPKEGISDYRFRNSNSGQKQHETFDTDSRRFSSTLFPPGIPPPVDFVSKEFEFEFDLSSINREREGEREMGSLCLLRPLSSLKKGGSLKALV